MTLQRQWLYLYRRYVRVLLVLGALFAAVALSGFYVGQCAARW